MALNTTMISVIIATKNRPNELKQCLVTLGKNSYRNFEIIIADQNRNPIVFSKFPARIPSITHIHAPRGGKSAALNKAIAASKGDILSFTDDDCIIPKNWLASIDRWFKKNPSAGGVCGKTLPYKPDTHQKMFCPATLSFNRDTLITNPHVIHYKKIGLGNNLALRKIVVKTIGPFTVWLGPGINGLCGGEDSDYIYRVLRHGFAFGQSSSILVFHNRWLSLREVLKLESNYTKSVIAFAVFHICRGDIGLTVYIWDRFKDYIAEPFVKFMLHLLRFQFREAYYMRQYISGCVRHVVGMLTGATLAIQNVFVQKS